MVEEIIFEISQTSFPSSGLQSNFVEKFLLKFQVLSSKYVLHILEREKKKKLDTLKNLKKLYKTLRP